MKYQMLLIAFCASCFMAAGELSEKEMKKLRRYVKIGSVSTSTLRGDDRKKTKVIRFTTTQDQQAQESYALRITAEVETKSGDTYCVQLMRKQPDVSGYEYLGEDLWEIHIPEGEMERPKFSGYVIEYGFMENGELITIAEEVDDVDTAEEITTRCETRLDDKQVRVKHAYVYLEDSGGGEERVESIMRTLRK